MKKARCLAALLALLLLLGGCTREARSDEAELEASAAKVLESLGGKERFLRADDDFTEMNFSADYIEERAVYLAEDGIGEWGLFSLRDTAQSRACREMLADYLENERAAIESLAALYPADELQERLALYQNAQVGADGALVWYFALPASESNLALRALRK